MDRQTALPDDPIDLRAGPLTCRFVAGDLLAIRVGDLEVIRRIYLAVRDHDWETVPMTVESGTVEREAHSFALRYEGRCHAGDIDYRWSVAITGTADGSIELIADGRAETAFYRNRVGLCILLPIRECAGVPMEIEAPSGVRSTGRFPRYVAPHQPADGIQRLRYVAGKAWAVDIRLDGELFEMEDQRNWTDASFKVYGTPLSLPFPVPVLADDAIRQSLHLRVVPAVPSPPVVKRRGHISLATSASGNVPAIGLGLGDPELVDQPAIIRRARTLRPSHLRIDVRLTNPDHLDRAATAGAIARRIGAPLEVAVFGDAPAEQDVTALAQRLAATGITVVRWLVFDDRRRATPPGAVASVRAALGRHGATAAIAVGTDAYFAELNRGRPARDGADLVTFSINPQVHAFDDTSILQTVEALPDVVASAKRFADGRPIAISPITLLPRFNPNATGMDLATAAWCPPPADPRLRTSFGAAWALGTLAALVDAGVSTTTWFDLAGSGGVIDTRSHTPSPLYRLFAGVAGAAGRRCWTVKGPDGVVGVAFERTAGTRLLLANLGDHDLSTSLRSPFAVETATDLQTGTRLMQPGSVPREITLLPLQIAQLDLA